MSDPIVHLEADDFPARARTALDDATLRGALDRVTDIFTDKRQAAVDTQPEWEAMRDREHSCSHERGESSQANCRRQQRCGRGSSGHHAFLGCSPGSQ